jgi:hypothetical protein
MTNLKFAEYYLPPYVIKLKFGVKFDLYFYKRLEMFETIFLSQYSLVFFSMKSLL